MATRQDTDTAFQPSARAATRRIYARAALTVFGGLMCTAALLTSSPTDAKAAQAWGPCAEKTLKSVAKCREVTVPLDHSGATPGEVKIRVAKEAVSKSNRPWLVYLSGGPGAAGVPEFFDNRFNQVKALRKRFNFIVFDQRGTGRSGALDCPIAHGKGPAVRRLEKLKGEQRRAMEIGECGRSLGSKSAFYTTRDSVADLEGIRQQLGLGKMTLFGSSYGTKVALAYANAHPEGVERLILDGVVAPDESDPFELHRFAALRESLTKYCEVFCPTLDPVADLAALVKKMRARPLQGHHVGMNGRRVAGRITVADLESIAWAGDHLPPIRHGLPGAVFAALKHNDLAGLFRLKLAAKQVDGAEPDSATEFSGARMSATICAENPLPWSDNDPLSDRGRLGFESAARIGDAGFAPFDTQTGGKAAIITMCRKWPTRRPPAQAQVPYQQIPTLIFMESEDTRTPVSEAQRVAAQIPGSQQVLMPGLSHATALAPLETNVLVRASRACAQAQLEGFLTGKQVKSECTGVAPLPLYSSLRITDLKVASGVPRPIGRTISALQQTLADSYYQQFAFVGKGLPGLRKGRLLKTVGRGKRAKIAARFERFSFIPGVEVSGTLASGRYRLTVSGSKAVRGEVTTDGKTLEGVFGRRKVSCKANPRGGALRCRHKR